MSEERIWILQKREMDCRKDRLLELILARNKLAILKTYINPLLVAR